MSCGDPFVNNYFVKLEYKYFLTFIQVSCMYQALKKTDEVEIK